MTTSCYLPVFYCFWLSLSTRSFFEILFKELSGLFYCSIVNVLRCYSLVMRNFLSLTHFFLFVNNFSDLFFKFFRTFNCFATATIDYHIFMILSTYFLIFLSCFLSRCSAHATACLYYHYFPGMSTPIFKYFSNCLKQLKQFTIIYNFDNNANLPTVLWIHM